MKFWKRLKQQIEESSPEWRDKFLFYKDLKKLLNSISVGPSSVQTEEEFLHFLYTEIDKFNAFVLEQEEDFIIRQKEIEERIKLANALSGPEGVRPSEAEYRAEMQKIIKATVVLHGEMVLLVNYSNINYIGLAKISKKYDKRTGRLLRMPFIKKVLEQPFFATELISKLVKECENTMEMVAAITEADWGVEDAEPSIAMVVAEERIFKNTMAALMTMKEIRSTSSTYSPLSLPPLNLPEFDLVHSFQLQSPVSIL